MKRKNPYEETVTERLQKQAQAKFENLAAFAGKEKYIISKPSDDHDIKSAFLLSGSIKDLLK